MKKILFSLLLIIFNLPSLLAKSIDERINDFVEPATLFVKKIIFFSFKINESVKLPFVLIWLLLGAIFCTLYFKFINISGFKTAINIVRGKYTDPNDKGEVSHFQALTTALSGTVGLGNIAGVAVAISLGGAGATFWMIVAGILGMSAKFVECTLGVKFRRIDAGGTVHGGPMYYLRDAFEGKSDSLQILGKSLAFIFAIACVFGSFGGGNMFQVNQAYFQFSSFIGNEWLSANGWLFGLVMAVLVGIVILGGIKSIAKVTDKIVPFMCGIYVFAALIIIFYHFSDIPKAFGAIIMGAFAPKAIGGGVIGVMILGFRRAAFSNEAGVGSASIAHAAVKTNDPASEGLVALLEPFIDTVVICTMTALVLVITGFDTIKDKEGVELTAAAFSSVYGSFADIIMTLAVVLFAFSTMISWSYYGLQAWQYIFGYTKVAEIAYKMVFCLFVVIGASMNLGTVIDFSDAMIFLMCFPNVLGMYLLAPVVKKELNKYITKIKG